MVENRGWQIRLYRSPFATTTLEWTHEDIITEWKSFRFTKVVNDSGSGSVTFDAKSLSAVNLELLNKDCIITFSKPEKYQVGVGVKHGTDICFAIIPEVIEHSILGVNNHLITISGPGVGEMLNHSIVLPAGYPAVGGGNSSKREHAGIRPLDVWEDFRAEADARNTCVILPYVFFNSVKTHDSNEQPWDSSTVMNIVFEVNVGMGLLDVLKWAQDMGGFNFYVDFQGRTPTTQLFVTLYPAHREDVSGKVGLHLGRHIISSTKTTSRESVMSYMYSALTTDSIERVERSDTSSLFTYGPREYYWSDAENYAFFDATQQSIKLFQSRSFAPNTMTLEIAPNVDFRAFIDYDLFDLITYDNPELGTQGQYIVKGLAVSVSGYNETQELMLETPIQTFANRLYHELNREDQRFKFKLRQ